MSGAGFRTLVVASKVVPAADYAAWAAEHKAAASSLDNRDAKVCVYLRVCAGACACVFVFVLLGENLACASKVGGGVRAKGAAASSLENRDVTVCRGPRGPVGGGGGEEGCEGFGGGARSSVFHRFGNRQQTAPLSRGRSLPQVAECADRIERGLTLLGATAVEDKLQVCVCVCLLYVCACLCTCVKSLCFCVCVSPTTNPDTSWQPAQNPLPDSAHPAPPPPPGRCA